MLQSPLSGWPSGLRRQTQGRDPSATKVAESVLVHKCGRGFKSHSWHLFIFHIPLNGDLNKKNKRKVATAGNRTPINCLEGNYANHYTTVAVDSPLTDIQNVPFHSYVWEQNGSGELLKPLSGWPSGLRRQTQGCDPSTITVAGGFLVHECGRGFESHFWHIFFFFFFFWFVEKNDATAGNRTPINCLEGNYANHYTTVAVVSWLSDILGIFIFL